MVGLMPAQGWEKRPATGVVEDAASKGAISQLQEFVQGAKICPMPPNCPVLQWEYDTRMLGTSLEFRATVAFLLDGVPHHTVGAWKPSKKLAQRDAAERALGLYVNRWGELITAEGAPKALQSPADAVASPSEVIALDEFCKRLEPKPSSPPSWSHRWEGGLCQAFVELRIMEVPHTFPGKPCELQEAAYADTARRVLWYLQAPGFENTFEPDLEYVRAAAQEIPGPSVSWAKDGDAECEEHQLADRQNAFLKTQERLLQAYGNHVEVGSCMWYWSYERDLKDKGWPPLFRATVTVPSVGQTFVGTWLRGQKDAQMDACIQVSRFIDQEFPHLLES